MADQKPVKETMVTVETLKAHTNAGQSYDIGDTYDVPEAAVDNLAHLGMAVRVDRVAHAKKQASAAAKPAKAAKKSKKR